MSFITGEPVPPSKSRIPPGSLSVLYVDDEPSLLTVTKIYLERRGIAITTASSVRDALTILETFSFDVIVSDYQMPVCDGIVFLKLLQERKCTIPFILFTGKDRDLVIIDAINNGATYYIQKGGDPRAQFAELIHKIREASRRSRAEDAERNAKQRYHTLFEHTGTAIMTVEEDLVISTANTGFYELTGYEKNESVGIMRCTDLVSENDAEFLAEQFHLLRAGSIPSVDRIRLLLITKNKKSRYICATASLIPGSGRCIVSLIDITRLCYLEEALRSREADSSGLHLSFIDDGNAAPGDV